MAVDGGNDALSFAFVYLIHGESEARPMGMHVHGLPELIVRHADLGDDPDQIIELLRYVCDGEKPLGDGHIIADEHGPRYLVQHFASDSQRVVSPMDSPFGSLLMKSVKQIAEVN